MQVLLVNSVERAEVAKVRQKNSRLYDSVPINTRFREDGVQILQHAKSLIFDRPLETFSMGERKKVDLCRSFLAPAHLLIWDEPMNYVDLASREDLEEVILREEPTMLFVEHDRRFVERIATDVVAL